MTLRRLSCALALLPFSSCQSTTSASGHARMLPERTLLKPGEQRTFAITYTAHVKDVPPGTKLLRVWLPVPQDSPVQTIGELSFTGPQPRLTTEHEFGNRLAYYELPEPGAQVDLEYTFTCTRREQITDLQAVAQDGDETDSMVAVFLADDRLTIVDDRIRELAAAITTGKTTTLEKAHAIYGHVVSHMQYDKSVTGWGRGDTVRACEVGKGNCTDFHALFMSLARASGIPAGFEIGLYLPYERGKQEPLGGYHCWSSFRVPGKTWVPIDASEASKLPDRASYFFGAHTANRVTLSTGRDLVLEPPQAGQPLNFLLDPYAEADGASVPTAKDWTYRDV